MNQLSETYFNTLQNQENPLDLMIAMIKENCDFIVTEPGFRGVAKERYSRGNIRARIVTSNKDEVTIPYFAEIENREENWGFTVSRDTRPQVSEIRDTVHKYKPQNISEKYAL
jgi:hypothetical protein